LQHIANILYSQPLFNFTFPHNSFYSSSQHISI